MVSSMSHDMWQPSISVLWNIKERRVFSKYSNDFEILEIFVCGLDIGLLRDEQCLVLTLWCVGSVFCTTYDDSVGIFDVRPCSRWSRTVRRLDVCWVGSIRRLGTICSILEGFGAEFHDFAVVLIVSRSTEKVSQVRETQVFLPNITFWWHL